MKVTIRSVDKKLRVQAKHDAIDENKSLGEIVNEGLRLRQEQKAEQKKAT